VRVSHELCIQKQTYLGQRTESVRHTVSPKDTHSLCLYSLESFCVSKRLGESFCVSKRQSLFMNWRLYSSFCVSKRHTHLQMTNTYAKDTHTYTRQTHMQKTHTHTQDKHICKRHTHIHKTHTYAKDTHTYKRHTHPMSVFISLCLFSSLFSFHL